MITEKIKEIQAIYEKLKSAPKESEAKRRFIRENVGDAEVFIENLLVWLRKAKNKYETDNK